MAIMTGKLKILSSAFCVLFLAITLFSPKTVSAATLNIVNPDALDAFMNNNVVRLFIDGVIDESTPAQVEKVLSSYNGELWVFLNSPGGNLVAGLETGKILRKYRATTYVGEYKYTGKAEKDSREYEITPGSCESACAFTFLGGHYRFMYSHQSKFGVHRFWSTTGPKVDDLDSGQVISAAIVNYLNEMQINPELMNYVVSAGKSEMKYLDKSMMARLNVINYGRALPQWSIDLAKGAPYLSGLQEIMIGGGHIIMVCSEKNLVMLTRAQVGAENAQMIVEKGFAPHFMAQKRIGIPAPNQEFKISPTAFKAEDEFVDTTFIFPYRLEQALDNLDAFGVGFIAPDDSGRFIGFVLDIGNDENRERIKRFLSSCK